MNSKVSLNCKCKIFFYRVYFIFLLRNFWHNKKTKYAQQLLITVCIRVYCMLHILLSVKCKSTVELTKQWIQKKRYRDMDIHPMYKFCYSYKCAFLAFLLLCDTSGKKIGKNPGMCCGAFGIAFTEMKHYFIFSLIFYICLAQSLRRKNYCISDSKK